RRTGLRTAAAGAGAWGSASSLLHVAIDFRRGERALEVAERALLLYFARRFDKPGHRHAEKRRREADAAHAGFLELGDAERLALDADHEVDRLRDRRADLAHGLEIRQPGREQHVGARALEGLQALDGVLQIGIAAQEVFRTRGEGEWKRRALR